MSSSARRTYSRNTARAAPADHAIDQAAITPPQHQVLSPPSEKPPTTPAIGADIEDLIKETAKMHVNDQVAAWSTTKLRELSEYDNRIATAGLKNSTKLWETMLLVQTELSKVSRFLGLYDTFYTIIDKTARARAVGSSRRLAHSG